MLVSRFAHVSKCSRESPKQVGRNQTLLAHCFSGHVSGQAVEINGSANGFEGTIRILCNESSHHAGENVTGPASRHTWIASCVDPNLAAGVSNERAVAFQNRDASVIARESSRQMDAIAQNFRYAAAAESSHFARMRRNHQWVISAMELVARAFECVQTIGIDNHR